MTAAATGRCRGTVWLTGLSASGKTTLGRGLHDALAARGLTVALLDGDAIRERLPRRYGHGLEDRAEVLRHIVGMAEDAARQSDAVIVATISHAQWMRDLARERLSPFYEVHLDCPPSACAARDRKGQYARAEAGEYACFIGVTHDYERRRPADLTLDTRSGDAARTLEAALGPCLLFLGL